MRTLLQPDWVENYLPQFLTIVNAFRGKYSVIEDIRDLMTEDERELLEDLPGVF